jgi:hypothetical protein
MLYTVYSGSLTGPAERTTEDPALALGWALAAGESAYVTRPYVGSGPRTADVIWTPQMERCCTSPLHQSVLRTAITAGQA